ncbi:hypothetical protein JKP88DRAFT_244010 [Tribonema minus]|uniref:THIF-type NAD/FAD binding fold domain-containing protein n=1 Tax=Tribonema minus TaxID=303371 RepID=A0A836CIS8_9STRA|nr:hypothetical protein JKP88DRAFT_244010 [Tribonema minus]
MSATGLRAATLFVAGAATLATAQLLYAYLQQRRKTGSGASTASHSNGGAPAAAPREVPAEIEDELFSRNVGFFGAEGFAAIRDSFIVVVGLGGVGSHAAHMLARSGVRRLRLVDFDQVTLSSLNRHAVAAWSDVGLPKAHVLRDRLQAIVPGLQVDARVEMFTKDNADDLLSGSPAFVLDCIDDMNTKCELLSRCSKKGLRVICSVGAALKNDPSRLHIGSLVDAIRDPLAAKLKWRLKRHDVDYETINCVFLAANPVSDIMPLTDDQAAAPDEFGTVSHFRLRTLPVLGTIPAIFGQAMATFVLCEQAGKPFAPAPMVGLGKNLRNKLLQRLRAREMRNYPGQKFPIDLDDISYMVEQWRARCAVTRARMIGADQLELVRWDPGHELMPNNIVLLSMPVIKRVEAEGRDEAISAESRAFIEATLRQQRADW